MTKRNTFTYLFKVGHKPIHGGQTNDLARRENEHQRNLNQNGHKFQVGIRKTKQGALRWERENGF